ncbi:hypothetical protein K469DRAFT_614744, partial [Zopfia rhizophila CBS 207.26]
ATSSKGHDMIVEILLAYDATVKVSSRCYRSDADALQASLSEGHNKIVEMLLTKGVNANV